MRDAADAASARDDRPALTIVASARREGAALELLSDAHRPSVAALSLTTGAAGTQTQVISA